MSTPVLISVTQCSTWTRVFISRKKYSASSCSPAESCPPAPAGTSGPWTVPAPAESTAHATAPAGVLHGARAAALAHHDLEGLLAAPDRLGRARHDRHARRAHQLARAGLRAHPLDRAGRRADEGDPLALAGRRECRVLGQEAVARMDRLGVRAPGHVQDLLHVEVVLGGRPRPEVVRLAGPAGMQGLAIELGAHGHA